MRSMLLNTDGRQYAFSELDALLRRAGFEDIECRRSFGYYSLISAIKPLQARPRMRQQGSMQ